MVFSFDRCRNEKSRRRAFGNIIAHPANCFKCFFREGTSHQDTDRIWDPQLAAAWIAKRTCLSQVLFAGEFSDLKTQGLSRKERFISRFLVRRPHHRSHRQKRTPFGVLFCCDKRVKRSKIEVKLSKRSTFSSAAFSTNENWTIILLCVRKYSNHRFRNFV